MINFLSINNIINFHEKIIKQTGGSIGIRENGLIESALNRALASYDGKDLYPSDIDKISVITHSLICNHGFTDGNKRVGINVNPILIYYIDNRCWTSYYYALFRYCFKSLELYKIRYILTIFSVSSTL